MLDNILLICALIHNITQKEFLFMGKVPPFPRGGEGGGEEFGVTYLLLDSQVSEEGGD